MMGKNRSNKESNKAQDSSDKIVNKLEEAIQENEKFKEEWIKMAEQARKQFIEIQSQLQNKGKKTFDTENKIEELGTDKEASETKNNQLKKQTSLENNESKVSNQQTNENKELLVSDGQNLKLEEVKEENIKCRQILDNAKNLLNELVKEIEKFQKELNGESDKKLKQNTAEIETNICNNIKDLQEKVEAKIKMIELLQQQIDKILIDGQNSKDENKKKIEQTFAIHETPKEDYEKGLNEANEKLKQKEIEIKRLIEIHIEELKKIEQTHKETREQYHKELDRVNDEYLRVLFINEKLKKQLKPIEDYDENLLEDDKRIKFDNLRRQNTEQATLINDLKKKLNKEIMKNENLVRKQYLLLKCKQSGKKYENRKNMLGNKHIKMETINSRNSLGKIVENIKGVDSKDLNKSQINSRDSCSVNNENRSCKDFKKKIDLKFDMNFLFNMENN